jgi:hypothetical protein
MAILIFFKNKQLKVHHRVVDTSGKRKKSSFRKVLTFLFGYLWLVGFTKNIDNIFPLSSLLGVSSLILFKLFATGVIDTGSKFAIGIIDTNVNNTSSTVGKIYSRCR